MIWAKNYFAAGAAAAGAAAAAGCDVLREMDLAEPLPILPTPSELRVSGFDLAMTGVRDMGIC